MGDFTFAVDLVTGTSTASGANVAVIYAPFAAVYFVGAGSLAADRRRDINPTDTLLVGVGLSLGSLTHAAP